MKMTWRMQSFLEDILEKGVLEDVQETEVLEDVQETEVLEDVQEEEEEELGPDPLRQHLTTRL